VTVQKRDDFIKTALNHSDSLGCVRHRTPPCRHLVTFTWQPGQPHCTGWPEQWMERRGNWLQFLAGSRELSGLQSASTGSCAHTACHSESTMELKRSWPEDDHSFPSKAEVKNSWSYACTPPLYMYNMLLTSTKGKFDLNPYKLRLRIICRGTIDTKTLLQYKQSVLLGERNFWWRKVAQLSNFTHEYMAGYLQWWFGDNEWEKNCRTWCSA